MTFAPPTPTSKELKFYEYFEGKLKCFGKENNNFLRLFQTLRQHFDDELSTETEKRTRDTLGHDTIGHGTLGHDTLGQHDKLCISNKFILLITKILADFNLESGCGSDASLEMIFSLLFLLNQCVEYDLVSRRDENEGEKTNSLSVQNTLKILFFDPNLSENLSENEAKTTAQDGSTTTSRTGSRRNNLDHLLNILKMASNSASSATNSSTLITQIIKQSSILFRHLLIIHNSSSTSTTTTTSVSLERALLIITKNAFSSHTPKVRKVSVEVMKIVLESLAPPLLTHPLTTSCCDLMSGSFAAILADSNEAGALDLMGSLRILLPIFVKQSSVCMRPLYSICENILQVLTKSTSPLSRNLAFSLLALAVPQAPIDLVQAITAAISPLRPWKGESKPWLRLCGTCCARLAPSSTAYTHVFHLILTHYLLEGEPDVVLDADVVATLGGIVRVASCAAERTEMETWVRQALADPLLAEKWGSLLTLTTYIFEGCEDCREYDALLQLVMGLRDDPAYASAFPFKKECEEAIQSAIRGLGCAAFTQVVPFAIDAESGYVDGGVRRPYLLTSMYEALTDSKSTMGTRNRQMLSFLSDSMYPLMQRLYKKTREGKSELEVKLYETMLDQCWALHPYIITPGHVGDPRETACDFETAWPRVVPVLGGVLGGSIEWTSPSTLKSVLKSVTFVVSSNQPCVFPYTARFLAALANMYLTPPSLQECRNKGTTLQVAHERQMQALEAPLVLVLSKCAPDMVVNYFLTLIKQSLANTAHSACMDLIMLFLPHLVQESGNEKWQESPLALLLRVLLNMVESDDATTQKKAYKCLVKLVAHPVDPLVQMGPQGVAELIETVCADSVLAKVSSGAVKNRVTLFAAIVAHRPETTVSAGATSIQQSNTGGGASLSGFIEMCLPEVMLATKEANEKTRDAAYVCVIGFAHYMVDLRGETQLRDFLHMVTAGLGGESPHMQSAAIATLGRLFFEFFQHLEDGVCGELLETVLVAMSFRNREVTKAALGFVKVCVVCMPLERLAGYLGEIVKAILLYTHRVHKAHFKSKTRHLFERLIRKFGYERIDNLVPGDDKKLIMNIKKRREAAARRKIAGVEGEGAGGGNGNGTGKAGFEEAFHDSGSELGSDDEEKYIPKDYRNETLVSKKNKKKGAKTVIREGEGDDVVDFLDQKVISQVSHQFTGLRTTTSDPRTKTAKDGADFKTGAHGRMIIDESNSEDDDNGANVVNVKRPKEEISEDYYKQSLASEVSFTRTADGRVKFVKRKRGDAVEDGAATTFENGAADTQVGRRWHAGFKRSKKDEKEAVNANANVNEMLGRQYKAKKAKGDVKKAGMPDPYAYIPLSGKIVGNMNKSTKLDSQLKGVLKASASTKASTKASSSIKSKSSRINKKHNKK